jgi:hypothetical protein
MRSLIERCIFKKVKKNAQSMHCILAVSLCCGKDLGIITEGGDLDIFVVRPIFSYASLVWWKRVELKNAHLQPMTCLGISGGMRSTPMSTLEVMSPSHFFHKTRGQTGGY